MLHFAAGLRSPECVKITECLLKASADPNMTAVDEQLSFDSSLRRRKVRTSLSSEINLCYDMFCSRVSPAIPYKAKLRICIMELVNLSRDFQYFKKL